MLHIAQCKAEWLVRNSPRISAALLLLPEQLVQEPHVNCRAQTTKTPKLI